MQRLSGHISRNRLADTIVPIVHEQCAQLQQINEIRLISFFPEHFMQLHRTISAEYSHVSHSV